MKKLSCVAVGVALLFGMSITASAEVRIGEAAPDFTLMDTEENQRSLSDYLGSFVVLEWFNPECPFVRKHYGSGNMQALQDGAQHEGVIWLTINSSAPGKQGHLNAETGRAVIETEAAQATALLLDPEGAVGRLYGAKTTPHMFLIDQEGVLIYQGAIDDRPTANPADIQGAVNYVKRALDQALGGEPVEAAETQPYGCSVKYDKSSWIDQLIQR